MYLLLQGWPRAQVSISVSAELGELAIFVSGRAADVWWPPEVCLRFYGIGF